MNLSDFSKKELQEELKKRAKGEEKEGSSLIVGTLCFYPEGVEIEIFKKIEKPEDLAFLDTASLRARMNSQRQYKLFYFKSNQFEALEEVLKKEYKRFVEFVVSNNLVSFEGF